MSVFLSKNGCISETYFGSNETVYFSGGNGSTQATEKKDERKVGSGFLEKNNNQRVLREEKVGSGFLEKKKQRVLREEKGKMTVKRERGNMI